MVRRPEVYARSEFLKPLSALSRPAAKPADPSSDFDLGFREPFEIPLKLVAGEVARRQTEKSGSADHSSRDEAVLFQAPYCLLNPGERAVEEPSELACVALVEQTESYERFCSRAATEWRRLSDHHKRSYDHL